MDDCIVGFAVCLQTLAQCCQCFVCLWNCYIGISGDESDQVDEERCQEMANCLTYLSDFVNLIVLSCMLTQQQVEVDDIKATGYGGMRPEIVGLLPPMQQKMVQSGSGAYRPLGSNPAAPPQSQVMGSGGVAIPREVKQGFLAAGRKEYVGGQSGAVGRYFDELQRRGVSHDIIQALDAEEQIIRDSRRPFELAFQDLAARWNM